MLYSLFSSWGSLHLAMRPREKYFKKKSLASEKMQATVSIDLLERILSYHQEVSKLVGGLQLALTIYGNLATRNQYDARGFPVEVIASSHIPEGTASVGIVKGRMDPPGTTVACTPLWDHTTVPSCFNCT
jgi:hypothetical protein